MCHFARSFDFPHDFNNEAVFSLANNQNTKNKNKQSINSQTIAANQNFGMLVTFMNVFTMCFWLLVLMSLLLLFDCYLFVLFCLLRFCVCYVCVVSHLFWHTSSPHLLCLYNLLLCMCLFVCLMCLLEKNVLAGNISELKGVCENTNTIVGSSPPKCKNRCNHCCI